MNVQMSLESLQTKIILAQSTEAVEYTDYPPNECPGYDTKQSDGELPVMVELWGMQSTPLLPLLPSPLWPGVIAPDWVLSMNQIELNCVLFEMERFLSLKMYLR